MSTNQTTRITKTADPDANAPEWHRGFLDGKHGRKNDRDRYKDLQEWTNYHDGWLTGDAERDNA